MTRTATLRRHDRQRLLHGGIQRGQLVDVGLHLRVDSGGIDPLDLGELDTERLDGAHHTRRIGPDVGVVAGVLVALLRGAFLLVIVVVVELEQLDVIGELEHRCTRRLDLLDDVDHPFFESSAVDDEQVGVLHRLGLLRRRCEVMRIGTDRHDHLDLGQVADRLGHDVAQDVGGDHDRRQLPIGRGRGARCFDRVGRGDGLGGIGRCVVRAAGGGQNSQGADHRNPNWSENLSHSTKLEASTRH